MIFEIFEFSSKLEISETMVFASGNFQKKYQKFKNSAIDYD